MQFYYATLVTENLFLYLLEVLIDGAIFATVIANNVFVYTQNQSMLPYLRQGNYAIIAVEITFSLFSGTVAIYTLYASGLDFAGMINAIFISFSVVLLYLLVETGFAWLFILYLDDKYPQITYIEVEDDEEAAPVTTEQTHEIICERPVAEFYCQDA